ncbi:MAG: 6-bladed beta-propeller [Bacteroidales bacterium]|jgi:hypothetical protein|nr:6-bladed beta-propeller [Bacteroidales bacterium]
MAMEYHCVNKQNPQDLTALNRKRNKRKACMKVIVYFLVVLIFSQCKMSSNNSGTGDFVEIDISKKYPEKEVYIQDIAKVEYIPLETNSSTLMRSSARIVHVSDNYIIVTNASDGDVFVFDGNGKSKFSFNHKGKSGTDYNRLYSIAFDEQAKEIFIFDRASAHPKFLVYAEDGEFKRILESPSNFLPRDVYNFDDNTLLVYDEYGLSTNKYSNKPYMLISKKDGSIIDTLDIYLPDRVSNKVYFEVEVNGQKMTTSLNLNMFNNRSYGKDFLIADWSSDTIYRLTSQKKLQPLIIRKPSVQNSEPKTVITNELITDKFIFMGKGTLDFELAKKANTFPTMSLMYDFETGQLSEYKLINRDFESSNVGFYPAITSENTGVMTLVVSRLFEADEAGKIKGELKQVLELLDEEDNPILMKIKF